MKSECVVAEMLVGNHISVVFVHPLGGFEVGDVFLHVCHYFIDIFTFAHHGHGVLLVEVVLCMQVELLGPNLLRT